MRYEFLEAVIRLAAGIAREEASRSAGQPTGDGTDKDKDTAGGNGKIDAGQALAGFCRYYLEAGCMLLTLARPTFNRGTESAHFFMSIYTDGKFTSHASISVGVLGLNDHPTRPTFGRTYRRTRTTSGRSSCTTRRWTRASPR
jgi:hypothetical protein